MMNCVCQMRLLRGVEAIQSSLFDAEKSRECLKGVSSVLSSPLWLQTYVSIVNRSIDILCTYIRNSTYDYYYYSLVFRCKYITYDLFLIFPRFFDKFRRGMLHKLCKAGNLHDLIKIHDRFEWSRKDVRSSDNYAFIHACEYGHLDVVKWLCTVFQLTIDDVRTFEHRAIRDACANGHIEVARWLNTVFQLTAYDLLILDFHAFSRTSGASWYTMAKLHVKKYLRRVSRYFW